jgi:hypothetical protein
LIGSHALEVNKHAPWLPAIIVFGVLLIGFAIALFSLSELKKISCLYDQDKTTQWIDDQSVRGSFVLAGSNLPIVPVSQDRDLTGSTLALLVGDLSLPEHLSRCA